jgi:hypothetical protein
MDVYQPLLAEFRALAKGATNLIPVYREFAADLETSRSTASLLLIWRRLSQSISN